MRADTATNSTAAAQMELITTAAMKAGFAGGLVVDYPNSTKAKKFFLCLYCGPPSAFRVRHSSFRLYLLGFTVPPVAAAAAAPAAAVVAAAAVRRMSVCRSRLPVAPRMRKWKKRTKRRTENGGALM